MEPKKDIPVDSELYVNAATLDLLRRQIEADVRRGFFRRVASPLAIIGVAAILFSVFLWIPTSVVKFIQDNSRMVEEELRISIEAYLTDRDQGQMLIRDAISEVVRTDEKVRETLMNAARSYLEDPEKGELIIREVAEGAAKSHIQTAVTAFFESASGQKALDGKVEEPVRAYMETESWLNQLGSLVGEYMKSDKLRLIIAESVDKSLKSIEDP